MKIVPAREFDLKREVEYGTAEQNETVRRIVADIRREGDAALLRYTEQLDRTKLTAAQLRVPQEELQAAYAAVEPSL